MSRFVVTWHSRVLQIKAKADNYLGLAWVGFCLLWFMGLDRRGDMAEETFDEERKVRRSGQVKFRPRRNSGRVVDSIAEAVNEEDGVRLRRVRESRGEAVRDGKTGRWIGWPKGVARKYTAEVIGVLREHLDWWREVEGNYLLLQWCQSVGIARFEALRLCAMDADFKSAWDLMKEKEELRLVMDGLEGRKDPQMSKFVLASHHDYKGERMVEVEGEIGLVPRLPSSPEETRVLIEQLEAHRASLSKMVEDAKQLGPALAGG